MFIENKGQKTQTKLRRSFSKNFKCRMRKDICSKPPNELNPNMPPRWGLDCIEVGTRYKHVAPLALSPSSGGAPCL